MSVPTYNPASPIQTHGSFKDNVAFYGKPPKGYRWLKVGEVFKRGDFFVDPFLGKWDMVDGGADSPVMAHHWPSIRQLRKPPLPVPSIDAKIAALQKEIAALDKKVYEMTAETNKVVAESRQKSEDLKVLLHEPHRNYCLPDRMRPRDRGQTRPKE